RLRLSTGDQPGREQPRGKHRPKALRRLLAKLLELRRDARDEPRTARPRRARRRGLLTEAHDGDRCLVELIKGRGAPRAADGDREERGGSGEAAEGCGYLV